MNVEQILKDHVEWLRGDGVGCRADLRRSLRPVGCRYGRHDRRDGVVQGAGFGF